MFLAGNAPACCVLTNLRGVCMSRLLVYCGESVAICFLCPGLSFAVLSCVCAETSCCPFGPPLSVSGVVTPFREHAPIVFRYKHRACKPTYMRICIGWARVLCVAEIVHYTIVRRALFSTRKKKQLSVRKQKTVFSIRKNSAIFVSTFISCLWREESGVGELSSSSRHM
ncbi:unnamed protein product [Laminaria digitata]